MSNSMNAEFNRLFQELLHTSTPADVAEIHSRCAKGMKLEEAIRDLIFVRWGLCEKANETMIH